jgi:hypothetical protein
MGCDPIDSVQIVLIRQRWLINIRGGVLIENSFEMINDESWRIAIQ